MVRPGWPGRLGLPVPPSGEVCAVVLGPACVPVSFVPELFGAENDERAPLGAEFDPEVGPVVLPLAPEPEPAPPLCAAAARPPTIKTSAQTAMKTRCLIR